jgi:hypothetical protein
MLGVSSTLLDWGRSADEGGLLVLFVSDDWAEDHHDVEVVDDAGQRLAKARLPEGIDGITRLHALIGEHTPPEWAELDPVEAATRVKVGIETDRRAFSKGYCFGP